MLALGARGHEFDSRKSPRCFFNRFSVPIILWEIRGPLKYVQPFFGFIFLKSFRGPQC
jgi:hypothetical protein